jgi:hypothetical protein
MSSSSRSHDAYDLKTSLEVFLFCYSCYMQSKTSAILKDQLIHPLKYLDRNEYSSLRKKKIIQALAIMGTGITILIVAPILYAHGQLPDGHRPRNNGSGLIFLAFGLPLLGFYLLMTITRRIESECRAKLLWLHPELKSVEAERVKMHKDSKAPKFIIIILVSIILLAGLCWYIVSLIQFAQS